MEGHSKLPSLDFADLLQNAEISTVSLIGPSRAAGCSVDLKLGGSGDLRPPEKWKAQQPPKRARAAGNGGGGQVAACSVDGCRSDLSNSREYHRRHKVCEAHSKTPVVMVGGREQRFCQQCSRFHQLVEFDEGKRSCRKRLDGHNRRRRKPRPADCITNPSSSSVNNRGNKFFLYPHLIPAPVQETASHFTPQQHSSSSISSSENTNMKHFHFQSFIEASPLQSSGGLDCAISLLSSAQNPAALLEMGGMLPAWQHRPSVVSPLPCTGIDGRLISRAGIERAGFVCDADRPGLHECRCVLGVMGEAEGSSEEASRALPFHRQ